MKFTRRQKFGSFQDTPRKRAALLRKQKKQQEAFPLFAAEIAENQPSADEVMKERAIEWDQDEIRWRAFIAKQWREVRGRFYALPAESRYRLRQHASECSFGPFTPVRWAYLIREELGGSS